MYQITSDDSNFYVAGTLNDNQKAAIIRMFGATWDATNSRYQITRGVLGEWDISQALQQNA